MNINSAFSSGVFGLQKATAQMDSAASKIAQQTLPSAGSAQASGSAQGVSVQQNDSLPDSLVQLKTAEIQGKSSVEVIKRADQMLGSLLDIHV